MADIVKNLTYGDGILAVMKQPATLCFYSRTHCMSECTAFNVNGCIMWEIIIVEIVRFDGKIKVASNTTAGIWEGKEQGTAFGQDDRIYRPAIEEESSSDVLDIPLLFLCEMVGVETYPLAYCQSK
eukprot:14661746-Ditylum_brightwellii.AAC.1